MIAALLVVLLVWLARRKPAERIVNVAATPTIVTVPVPIALTTPAVAPAAPPSPTVEPPHPARVQVRAAPKPVAPASDVPPPAASVAPSDVTTRYREVGTLLKAHGTDTLWQRYRWIRLGDCLTTEAKRADCVRMLDAIASDAAGK